ncbi:MAG: hypothetical protein BGO21_20795 [Dyadobacter sp. 50-39]|uniref:ComEC/Rec2 family competence protein n=1 Tax=Dyadobacter sp. 50-39 TaxID=1895756 RepID=UPI00096466AF|nr:MBL fold metallo-hydrolase [Dyadobacter sp. 50-39]OJV19146.1 MAG: hypothetical protein BGO21_20795 [Dyadobacter sp. 50-39]
MNISINMLDVNDGDAIIVHLERSAAEQLVIIIDSGHKGDWQRVTTVTDPILKKANKSGPDLIICTHYDADHIGGLMKVVQHYNGEIQQVWIHHPGLLLEAFKLASSVLQSEKAGQQLLLSEARAFKSTLLAYDLSYEAKQMVLESYEDMLEFVKFLQSSGIQTQEPFPDISFPGWPELKVLGPTRTFYGSLLDRLGSPANILIAEMLEISQIEKKRSRQIQTDPCHFLDSQNKSGVTAVNQASVILEITADEKKYLFTGDASLESFNNIPNYPESLRDIFWLKVAHHGSQKNSTSELFKIMSCKHAFISGRRHLDEEVAECLTKKGAVVRTTKTDGDLVFP